MLVIIDYGVGNLNSIRNMLKKGGISALISGKAEDIANASKILLPGMGHFDNCMIKLNASGLMPTINKKVFGEKIPVLGICVGLQMLMASSEEGVQPGLNWVEGRTVRFQQQRMPEGLKIPNMGWHEVEVVKESPLMEGLEKGSRFYFAHSFHAEPVHAEDTLLCAHYGYRFAAALEKDNIAGVQFHPEKSHRFGLRLLKNFAVNY